MLEARQLERTVWDVVNEPGFTEAQGTDSCIAGSAVFIPRCLSFMSALVRFTQMALVSPGNSFKELLPL